MNRRLKLLIVLLLLSIVTLQGQACSPGVLSTTNSSVQESSDSSSDSSDDTTTSTDLKAVETYRIAHAREILPDLMSILNIDASYNSQIYSVYSTVDTNLSEDGESSSVSAPMWNSIVSISGTTCNEALTAEKKLASADRTTFIDFNFDKTPKEQPSNAVKDLIHRLARRSWQRNETDEERQMILDALASFDTTSKTDTTYEALFVCSAVLSSLDAVVR